MMHMQCKGNLKSLYTNCKYNPEIEITLSSSYSYYITVQDNIEDRLTKQTNEQTDNPHILGAVLTEVY